ncbi:hypothetical protein K402DRAFT_226294 [Aulographum hederae CBS 113979]|uniref:Lysine-specific metallo-endopeptidase domain-containing protein n=1 Tax=Aulographum hederae CBS 113979 TaxID=1176131 RepID=A0A6G1HAP5_9PEZI|nr:hypothetical protein K402DRAFT_226294 [Aulographum hederae CBS 113979]
MVKLSFSLLLTSLLTIFTSALPPGSAPQNPNPHSLLARAAGLVKRHNIDNFKGCNAEQKAQIQVGYEDALKLADKVWRLYYDELFTAADHIPGSLPDDTPWLKRCFGDIQDSKDDYIRATNVYNNIRNWWPYRFFDWIFGKRIHAYCTDEFGICVRDPGIGAYARNLDDGPRITLCPPHFYTYTFPSLDVLKECLDTDWQNKQKHIASYRGAGHIFLHEMVHLEVISGKPHIPDVKCWTGETEVGGWYGPYKTERLAKRWPECARNNADNYAVFASAYWFSKFYGTPDVPTSKSGLSANSNDDQIGNVDASESIYADEAGSSSGNEPAFGDSGYFPDVDQLNHMASVGKSLEDAPETLTSIPA